jgi:hypothetical protein
VGARAAARAAGDSASSDDPYAAAFAAVAEGCAATAEGAEGDARESFERGLLLFEQQTLTTEMAEARITYAWALDTFGDIQDAREQLAMAREVFDAMSAFASVAYVDEILRGIEERMLLLDRGAS